MPELPEVEVIRRRLADLAVDRRVTSIRWSGKRLRLPVPRSRLKKDVLMRRVVEVGRRAKYIIIRLENGAALVMHLGMSGRLCAVSPEKPRGPHDHLVLSMDDLEIRFHDPRRFGSIQVAGAREEEDAFFRDIGPEPFWEDFTASHLSGMARARKKPVKNFLMDNGVVAGIGNIYASEILFAAAVAPTAPASSLPIQAWRRIVEASRTVLARAIELGGTTISDFAGLSGDKGMFQTKLRVYGRADQGCDRCQKGVILRTVMAGRATYHCSSCQKSSAE